MINQGVSQGIFQNVLKISFKNKVLALSFESLHPLHLTI